jgi:DNA-binding MarR family transcriptional regulator
MAKSESAVDFRRISEALSLDEELDGVDLRVFLFLFSRLDFETYTRVEQREIAESLKRHKVHVSRSIRKLKAKKMIIEATPRIGRSPSYVLNRAYGT